MTPNPLILFVIAALLGKVTLPAESCRIESTSPPGQWKFVRVYDADTGQVVLRQAINGGDSKPVTVSGHQVRVEYKLPGHTRYTAPVVASCKGGNTVRT